MQIENQKAVDFRSLLQSELVRRTKANPRYSLRAFARVLGVQSGFLSKILLGQRRVTPASVRRFGLKLGLPLPEIEEFESQALSRSKGISRSLSMAGEADFRQITYDHFQMISDWYYFAILELAAVRSFVPNPRWVARKLGLTLTEAQDALDRLVRLGYIKIEADGNWKVLEGHTTTLGNEETAVALRRMQKQILEKAIMALEEIPVSKRDQSAMTMAINSSKLPEAKEKIKKFRRELCAFLEGDKDQDAVYQLSVSLYPLTLIADEKSG